MSKLVFVDDFTHDGQWVKDADNSRRCRFQYPSDETLQLAKGGKGFFDPKEAGLLCVATPTDDSLDLNLVADTRLSVTVATDEAAAGDRVGFVCREGTGRYHLTVARDGIWRIEKVADGQLITHSACQNKRGHPGHGLDLAEGGLYRRRVGQTGAAGALGERGQAARPGSRPRSASVRGGRGGNCRGRPDPFSAAFGVRPLVSMNLARESRSLDGV